MKKLLSLGLIIAAVLSLGLTGCTQNADEDKLPGAWTNTAELYSSWQGPYDVGTLTASNYKVTYELNKPSEIDDEDKPEEGYYNSISYAVTKGKIYTGFRASVTSNAEGGSGFIFCQNVDGNGRWSYYYLYINKNGRFYLEEKVPVTGEAKTIKDWTSNEAIKGLGETNDVLVYTDKNNNIIINVNEVDIYTIRNPELNQGGVGIICTVGYGDVANDTHIKVVYDFKEFQY